MLELITAGFKCFLVVITENLLFQKSTVYMKNTANFILNGEKLNVHKMSILSKTIFSSKSETRQGCPLLLLLFNIILQALATAIRQKKEIQGIHIGKEVVKLSLFADDICYTHKILETAPKNY